MDEFLQSPYPDINTWLGHRQLHVESGTFVGAGGVGPDATVVRFHHTFDKRESRTALVQNVDKIFYLD